MTRSAGLTLVELLLSLSLLASLTVVGVDWTVTAARLSADSGEIARWNAAARAALDRVGDDLLQGDFEPFEGKAPRVWVETDRLSVATRAGAPARVAYSCADRALSRSAPGAGSRLLLEGVAGFRCGTEPVRSDEEEAEAFVLTVAIWRDEERTLSRSYVLPREWLP